MQVPKDRIFRGEPLPPVTEKSLGKLFHKALKEHGDKIALIDAETNEAVTYSEILQKSEQLALWLKGRGVKPGDVVGICSENSLEFLLPILAAHYVGAICAPVNSSYTVRELAHAFSLSKPKTVFCSEFTEETVHETVGQLSFVQEVVVLGQNNNIPKHKRLSDVLKEIVHSSSFTLHEVKDPSDEVAFIFCSSGTTGLPKGVMITHANMLALAAMFEHPSIIDQDDLAETTIGYLPMFHAYGINVLLTVMKYGRKLIVMPQFNPDTFLELVQEYKVDTLLLVPPIVSFLAKNPMVDEYDLSSVRRVGVGAAPVSMELLNELKAKFPSIEEINQGYGLTEVTLGGLMNMRGKGRIGSVGTTAPGFETKIIDPSNGKCLGPNERGEICFRGPLVMKGYVNNPAATSETIDSEGWLHTGDVGYYDEDGFFYIVDRLKELIKYKGFQVAPAELEALLMSHPAVMDAAVIGIPDKEAGEVPRGYVVQKSEVTEKELIEFVERQVSSPKRLRGGIKFMDMIPKNPSGKILRRELREMSKSKL